MKSKFENLNFKNSLKIENCKLKIFLLLFTIYYFIFNINTAYGAEFSLGIYPPLLKIQAQPPAIINAPIIIQNLSTSAINLDIIIKPEISLNKIQVIEQNDPIQSLILAPKQKKDLFIKISIDKDDPQKDYYFNIQFISKESKIDKETSYSQILGGVSLSVILSVGKEELKASLEEFSSPVFIDKTSVPFVITIKNKGKHFITPYGLIAIKNLFGHTVSQIEVPATNLLKESTKSIRLDWNKSFILGLYTATLDLSISEHGHILSKSLSFFALPVRPMLTAIILILVIVLIFIRVKKRVKVL